MSDGDDGAPERASAKMQQGTPGRPKPPPPVPTAAKPPPPVRESNPFLLTPESSSKIDAGWLVLEDAPPSANEAPAPPAPAPVAASNEEPVKPQGAGSSEVAFSVPPFKKKSKAKVLGSMFLVVVVLVGGGLAYQSQMNARSASVERSAPETSAAAPVETSASTSEPAPPPTFTAEPPPSASVAKKKPAAGAGAPAAAVSADPATQAILDTTQLPPGRKIVVDGRMVGTSPRKVAVRCGTHRIVIGDLPPEAIAFPCGGEVNFTD